MFKSKRLSLLSIFALIVSSLSITGLNVSAASAAPERLTEFKINGTDITGDSVINLDPGTTSFSLKLTGEYYIDPLVTLGSQEIDVPVTVVPETWYYVAAEDGTCKDGVDGRAYEDTMDSALACVDPATSELASFIVNRNLYSLDTTVDGLVVGENTLTVVARDDHNLEYPAPSTTVILNVAPFLTNLQVDGANVADGDTVNLAANTSSVEVVATPTQADATVTITGATGLVAGENTLSILVEDADGKSATYTITLVVVLSTDTGASFTINGADAVEGEDIYVDYGTQSVSVTVATTDVNSTYFIDGDLGLETGLNDLSVIVTAADTSVSQEYHFNIIVRENNDTSVNYITVNGVSVVDGSNIDLSPYTAEVDVQVDTVDINATYTIDGGTELSTGDNQLMITVVAADGETEQQYFVNLNVLLGDDTSLVTFTVDGTDVVDGTVVDLAAYTSSVEVVAEATDTNATVEISGGSDLETGENVLIVRVTAENGVDIDESTVILNVVLSSDDTLAVLQVNGVDVANGDVINLEPYTVSVDVIADPNDENAVVEISGNDSLAAGENTLSVRTTAPNGDSTDIFITLVVALGNDNSLATFSVNGVDVIDGDTVELDPYTLSAEIVAVATDEEATVEISGGSDLDEGENTVTVTVTAVNGDVATYTITLNVLLSPDTSLALLQVNGNDAAEGDVIDLDPYTSEVDITVETTDSNAAYEITGDTELQAGENTLVIKVTAVNGDVYEYSLTLNVLFSTDNSLSSLMVDGVEVVDGEVVDLAPYTTEADVQVATADDNATFEISGNEGLEAGENIVTILVTAPSGDEVEYTVILNVLLSDDVDLATFTVNGIDVFAMTDNAISLPAYTTSVEVVAVPSDENSTVEIVGGEDLTYGGNDLTVIVTAPNGDSYEYSVVLDVALGDNAGADIYVGETKVVDGDLVIVDPYTTEVEVTVELADENATYEIAGNTELVVGENTIVVTVTAQNGADIAVSTITVSVPLGNNAGAEIFVQGEPVEDGAVIELPAYTTDVEVYVGLLDPEATYTIYGETGLVTGENTLSVTVVAADGETTAEYIYTLVVPLSDNTGLSVVNVNGNSVAEGDVVDLEHGTTSVSIEAFALDENAIVEVIGGDDLVTGSNTVTVVVTAVNGDVYEYVFTLNVLRSSETGVNLIEVNGQVYGDEVLEVDEGNLSVYVETTDPNATYVVEGNTNVAGLATVTITVTAEDGESTETFEVPVFATAQIIVTPSTGSELRVGTWAKFSRTQFERNAVVTVGWMRDGEVVSTSATKYLLTADDYGHDFRIMVTITNKAGTRIAISKNIQVLPGIIKKAPTPSIKGKAVVGNTLTGSTKSWVDGAELGYQWLRDGEAIDGATEETYSLTADDVNTSIALAITGTVEGYEPLTMTSKSVTVVPGIIKYIERPGMSGDFVTGGTVTVNPGVWQDDAEVSIQWLRNGAEMMVTAADENSYVLTADDYKQRLSVNILVTAAGYKDAIFKMRARQIKIGTLTDIPTPIISGSGIVGESLDVDPGEYPDGAVFTYVWKRDGRVIQSATDSSYTLTARDVNTTITVRVIANVPGYKLTRIDSDGVSVTPAQ